MKVCAGEYDSRSGLESLVCTTCEHRDWFARGHHPIVSGGHEFKFSYGLPRARVTVVLSSAAVNLVGHNTGE